MSLLLILGLMTVILWVPLPDKLVLKIRAKAQELADRGDQNIKDLENPD
jgi:hypothetical protein